MIISDYLEILLFSINPNLLCSIHVPTLQLQSSWTQQSWRNDFPTRKFWWFPHHMNAAIPHKLCLHGMNYDPTWKHCRQNEGQPVITLVSYACLCSQSVYRFGNTSLSLFVHLPVFMLIILETLFWYNTGSSFSRHISLATRASLNGPASQ